MPLGPSWLNRWLIPWVVATSYLIFYFSPGLRRLLGGLFDRLEEWSGSRGFDLGFLRSDFFVEGLRLEAKRKHIILALSGGLGLILLFDAVSGWKLGSYGEALWFSSLTAGFLNPIAEELLARGLFLNMFAFTVYVFGLQGWKKASTYMIGVTIVSLVFTVSHLNLGLFQSAVRFSSSLLFCAVYLLSERNLLPPIVAHAAWNWYLVGKDVMLG